MTTMPTNWNKDQPATGFIRQLVYQYFPAVSIHRDVELTLEPHARKVVRNHPMKGVGGYKQRTTEHGGFSLHSEGRAADIYVIVKNAYLKKFGDELFWRFVTFAQALGLEEVIWNRQEWMARHPTVRPRAASSDQHTDHLHVGFSRSGSQNQLPLLETLVREAAEATDAAFPSPAGAYQLETDQP